MEKTILNFHFDYLTPRLIFPQDKTHYTILKKYQQHIRVYCIMQVLPYSNHWIGVVKHLLRGSTNQRWKNKTIKRKEYMLETRKYLNYNIFHGVASSSVQFEVSPSQEGLAKQVAQMFFIELNWILEIFENFGFFWKISNYNFQSRRQIMIARGLYSLKYTCPNRRLVSLNHKMGQAVICKCQNVYHK